MSQHLDRIRELTETLHVIPLKSIASLSEGRVYYDCLEGSCYGHNLFNDGTIAVQYAEMEEGTVMKPHTHTDNKEYLIVISGHLQSTIDGVTSDARDGECIEIQPGETHIPSAPVKTRLIGITVPSSAGYPKGHTRG